MFIPIERFSPVASTPPWIRHEHFARYEWAATFAAGRSVLDVACGTAYGAPGFLAAGAKSYAGFDLDPEAIQEATASNSHLPADRFRVAVGDAMFLPLPDRSCDLFTSFETIEHLPDDVAHVREVARLLAPGGIFLVSTPNRAISNPGTLPAQKPYNRFHVREYTAAEFTTLLGGFFKSVTLFGQTFWSDRYAATLDRISHLSPRLAIRCHQTRKTLRWPLDRRDWHAVRMWPQRAQPEMLVARCQQ